MKVKLVRIGNSRGIRIPKAILEQCGLQEGAQLRVEKDRLVIAREHRPRQGWEEAFSAAGPSSNDESTAFAQLGLSSWNSTSRLRLVATTAFLAVSSSQTLMLLALDGFYGRKSPLQPRKQEPAE